MNYIFDILEDIQDTVHENNLMLKQICYVINIHLSKYHRENEDDFGRNVLANLLSGLVDIQGLTKRR